MQMDMAEPLPSATSAAPMVDVVFPVTGRRLLRDHAQALADALCSVLPWLAGEPHAGVHPIKLVPGLDAQALLSNRARLLLRVPRERAAALADLTGQSLEVGGETLVLGTPHARELLAHATLYAYNVASDSADELAFMEAVAEELDALGIRGHRVCGKYHRMAFRRGMLDSFSLMLHGLGAPQALLLQQRGLGGERLLGCGIFVPHKSAAAVGA